MVQRRFSIRRPRTATCVSSCGTCCSMTSGRRATSLRVRRFHDQAQLDCLRATAGDKSPVRLALTDITERRRAVAHAALRCQEGMLVTDTRLDRACEPSLHRYYRLHGRGSRGRRRVYSGRAVTMPRFRRDIGRTSRAPRMAGESGTQERKVYPSETRSHRGEAQ